MKRLAFILATSSALVVMLRWWERRSRSRASNSGLFDRLIALRGSGRDVWADEHADEFIRRLREGWE